ncbi:metalloregulator ArsR/SmtB family transcription factor [Bacillus sp. FSL R5-0432]|uniref:ArsR/SmtB family transcription factor n=1 Tax=unclassified Bacillus (in: firmicutes) TaxID=185979 RepID=UPI00057C5D33|nr:metalloregulator ArsR/SmtB family transcription factor [Bacillus sp. WP8]AIZ59172.1 hypothetical protein QR42_02320 [Bacillus sp. WP8]
MSKILTISGERETYEVMLSFSILWENALGIAAYTYPEIHPRLSKSSSYWSELEKILPENLKKELDLVQKHNTWYAQLQLLHQFDFKKIDEVVFEVTNLKMDELLFICLPYLGVENEEKRYKAAFEKDSNSISDLYQAAQGHKFFSSYLQYLFNVKEEDLKKHLVMTITGWYENVLKLHEEHIESILAQEHYEKSRHQSKYESEKFVKYVTGEEYHPEPNIQKVLLIPQLMYKPLNIGMTLRGTKVIYYAVSDGNKFLKDDRDAPPSFLVHTYKALADESRLRIVKHLTKKSYTLQELTEKLSIPKSTLHHHLSILKLSGLVSIQSSKYCLNKQEIDFINESLMTYIEEP